MTIKCQCFTKLFDFILCGFRKRNMDKNYTQINNLKISNKLLKFVNEDLLNGTRCKNRKNFGLISTE